MNPQKSRSPLIDRSLQRGQRQYVPIVVCCDPAKTEAFGCTLQSLGVSPIGTGEQCTDAEKACCRCY